MLSNGNFCLFYNNLKKFITNIDLNIFNVVEYIKMEIT